MSHALPGDTVDVKVIGRKGTSLFAEIESYRTRSSIAQDALCEVFGICGGCDWLNVPYEEQLNWKQNTISDIFQRIYPVEKVRSIIGADPSKHYRNKVFMPIGMQDDEPLIGMFARKSHDVIAHKQCYLQPSFFDDIFSIIRTHIMSANIPVYDEKHNQGIIKHAGIRYSEKTGEIIVVVVTKGRKLPFSNVLVKNLLKSFPGITGVVQNIIPASGDKTWLLPNLRTVASIETSKPKSGNKILGDEEKVLYGTPFFMDKIKDTTFRVHYQSFMQIHSHQAENLISYLDSLIAPGENVVDAFSGIGLIGLSIAKKCNWLYCIEMNEHAVEDTKFNVQLNNMNDVTCICAKVEDALPKIVKEQRIDTLIFDPPRKGLETAIIPLIADAKIPRIIYVSCNPSTQYRDVELFLKHGYTIREMQPFDLFPQTWHVENVVLLELS